MTPRLHLITRGDDAGSCVGANRAVAEAARASTLKNASVIACGPAFDDAAERLGTIPGLCIGLHVTLTSEWDSPCVWGPLTRSPLLTDARGAFPQDPRALAATDPAGLDAMLEEVAAQLARLRAAGLSPTYIDEHMALSSWAVPALRPRLEAFAQTEGLLGVWDIPQLPGEGSLATRLKDAADGVYTFITHPGVEDDTMRLLTNASHPPGTVAAQRDADRRLLLDPTLTAVAHDLGSVFVTYPDGLRAWKPS
jgi:predicted glycoside hydrolase/deacetylase ChbG (UPF0249 family)